MIPLVTSVSLTIAAEMPLRHPEPHNIKFFEGDDC